MGGRTNPEVRQRIIELAEQLDGELRAALSCFHTDTDEVVDDYGDTTEVVLAGLVNAMEGLAFAYCARRRPPEEEEVPATKDAAATKLMLVEHYVTSFAARAYGDGTYGSD